MIAMISRSSFKDHRLALSLRDVEDLLAEQGITASYETIWAWVRNSPQESRNGSATTTKGPQLPSICNENK